MAVTPSIMLDLGTKAPFFRLPNSDGKLFSLDEFEHKPLLVMFICNHCPYVRHIRTKLSGLSKEYKSRGVAVVAINSNDIKQYPDDSPANMKKVAAEYQFNFPYLFDETQEIAKAYRAACTPDFFLFDISHRLVYRGQMDSSRPGNSVPVTGKDLTAAIDNLLAEKEIASDQKPSLGCNIKWKPGNAPDYFR